MDGEDLSNEELRKRLEAEKLTPAPEAPDVGRLGSRRPTSGGEEEPNLMAVGYFVEEEEPASVAAESPRRNRDKWPWLWALLVSLLVVIALWLIALSSGVFGMKVVSPHTIHWHADLNIRIQGNDFTIPPSIGLLNNEHSPIHTHEPDNVVHMHNEGVVRERDVRLGEFFDVWGESFSKNKILDARIREGERIIMRVNGIENDEYENYPMRDGDVIDIILE